MECILKDEDVKEIADRYRFICNLTSDFFYCMAVPSDGPMNITWVEGAHQELTGYSAEDICNSDDWVSIVYPDDIPIVKNAARILLENRQHSCDYRIKAKSGNLRWVRDHARPVWSDKENRVTAIIGAIQNVTSQKRSEAALRASENRYRQFFLEDLSGAYITKPDGKMIACNPAFARIFGFDSVQHALKSDLNQIYRKSSSRSAFLEALKQKKKLVNYSSIMSRIDGTPIHTVENTIGIFDEQGNLVEIKGFLVDVTRQLKLEAQLKKARKMETVGTLAGGIAHEFNNLLMTIRGNASLIRYDLDNADPHYQMLEKIVTAVNRGVKLTQKLLGYAKKGKYEVQPLDLNQLIKESAGAFGPMPRDIAIQYELAETLKTIQADRDQMEQVLTNLLTNAIDAISGRGTVHLQTSNVTHENIHATLYDPIPGNYIKLVVADNGSGMDQQTRERIFDPFFTTKGMGSGKGLGLASVYGIIKSHGGYIEVESEKNHGTSFSVFLPASRKVVSAPRAATDSSRAKGGVVLIADDEEMVLEVGAGFLTRLGFTVLTAKNGHEAVQVYVNNREAIDLVILDMIMPHMGGGQAFDKIKHINPEVRVLLSSGYDADGQARAILGRGCDGFIQKPFTMRELSGKINEILSL